MSLTTITVAQLPSLEGKDLGHSSWLPITQERIDTFADGTNDHQYIHVDPERAKSGPFGTTIAHGFLTLSLFIPLWTEILEVTDASTFVNYGSDKVRFISPVPVGSKVRLKALMRTVAPVSGGHQLHVDGTMEIEGQDRPALIVESISRVYA
jgi:acyl dehydratase